MHDLRGHVQGLHPFGSAAGGAWDLSHCPALQAEPAAALCRWGLLLSQLLCTVLATSGALSLSSLTFLLLQPWTGVKVSLMLHS